MGLLCQQCLHHGEEGTHILRPGLAALAVDDGAVDMGDHLLDSCLQRDPHYLLEVLKIDAADGLQPEAVSGTGLGHCLILGAAGESPHGEEFDRAAAHVLEQGNGGIDGDDAVSLLRAEGAGEIFTIPGVPVGETRPLMRVSA